MAEKTFVIYRTDQGTATARPVLEYYTDDETHVPGLALLGYSTSTTAWVALDGFGTTEPADPTIRNALTVNPTAGTTAEAAVARYDVTYEQTRKLAEIADLIAQWNWTQELDAKITKATQADFAAWIEALEAIPSNALWATNPKGIALPAAPAVTVSGETVAQQVAQATWLGGAVVDSTKMNIANWDTLQPVWGFDTDNIDTFGSHPNLALSWAAGRSGSRALRATVTAGVLADVWIRPLAVYSFAMAPGDTFYVEAWVRASLGVTVNVGLIGFSTNISPPVPYNGGDGKNFVGGNGAWQRVSGYIQVPTGNPIRWGTAEVTFYGQNAAWVEIDGLTVTRVPRLPNAYMQATDTLALAYTGNDPAAADTLLTLSFFRGGSGATVRLTAVARIVPANTPSDAMRLQFWITRQAFGTTTDEAVTTWLEYSNGPQNHRNTHMEWTDAAADNLQVVYKLKASKLNSVSAMSVAHRSLAAILLPRL